MAARSGGEKSEKKLVNSRMVFRTKTKSRTETGAVRSGEIVSSAYSTLALGVMDSASVARMLFASYAWIGRMRSTPDKTEISRGERKSGSPAVNWFNHLN